MSCEEVFGGRAWGRGLVQAQGPGCLVARWLWPSFPPVPPTWMGPQRTEASGARGQPQNGSLCRAGSGPPMPGPAASPLLQLPPG